MSHTPGPWTKGEAQPLGDIVIYGPDGDSLALAECHSNISDEVEANARLIAVAPELLEVCEAICKLVDIHGEINHRTADVSLFDIREMAGFALDKYEGK